jgi:class 3 adenylate cyclase
VSRRLVVVTFLDLVGWSALAERVDPEPLQHLLEQYYEICASAVAEHGGEVEKFIGDAVMAVFGAARSEDDDAARALDAASQIMAAVTRLSGPAADEAAMRAHGGIAAGEALVTRSSLAGLRVVGDVVNVAARLQSAAAAGEILVNETVADLARGRFAMAAIGPVAVKGRTEPVRVFRVTGPAPAAAPGETTPLVDRDCERGLLRQAFARACQRRRAVLVTVLGPAGIGKTRLIRDVVAGIAAGEERPVAVFGDCPSYGPGRHHSALGQVLAALTTQSAASAALARSNPRVAAVLTSLARAGGPAAAGSAERGPGIEEVCWAAQELIGAAAAVRPVIVVLDSLEWAPLSLLRLVGHLRDGLHDHPVLLIGAARPELAESGMPWTTGRGGGDVIDVRALPAPDAAVLAAYLVAGGQPDEVQAHEYPGGGDRISRVVLHSAGNPLFIRLLLEAHVPGEPARNLPLTITALVGAMLDRLPDRAQRLLGAAAVIGSRFTLGQLAILDEPAPGWCLEVLVARQLIRPAAPAGDYEFVQHAVREVAYGRLDKEARRAWHQRLAGHGVGVAFHLEAAVALLGALRPQGEELPRLARQASGALLAEGTTALRQRDIPASIDLLTRALAVAPAGPDPDRRRPVVAIRLSDALLLSGDTRRAMDAVESVAQDSPADERGRRACLVQLRLLAARLGAVSQASVAALRADLEADPADQMSWCRFEQLRMLLDLGAGHFGAAERAAQAALEHARGIGDGYEEDRMLAALCEIRQWSPTPVGQRLADCAELADRFAADRFLLVPVLTARARALALAGQGQRARAALAEAKASAQALRLTMGLVLVDQAAGLACSLEERHAEARAHFRAAADALERAGNVQVALTMRVHAARESAVLRGSAGDGAAAELSALLARRAEMDVRGRLLCMSATARIAARDRATPRLLDEVRALAAETDDLCLRGDAYLDLAQAHRWLGNAPSAAAMAQAALDSYARVGATRPMELVRAWT